MRNVIIKKRKNIIMLLSFIMFIFLVKLFYNNELDIIDKSIYSIIKLFICTPLTLFFKFITEFGDIYIISFILIIFFIKKREIFYMELINLGLVVSLNQILKIIFLRPRPNYGIVSTRGYSFPSGHSMASVAFYGYLAYYIHKSNLNHKKIYEFLLSFLVFLIGLSRIYLGAHYATDVLAGYFLSLSHVLLFIILTYKGEQNEKKSKRYYYNY